MKGEQLRDIGSVLCAKKQEVHGMDDKEVSNRSEVASVSNLTTPQSAGRSHLAVATGSRENLS